MVLLRSYCSSVALFFCFFFNQKTAYELRISDWSSDVCSSDLLARWLQFTSRGPVAHLFVSGRHLPGCEAPALIDDSEARSEERRVGKECVSTCRSRWSPDH